MLVGALGADWFYLSHGSLTYLAMGTVCSTFCPHSDLVVEQVKLLCVSLPVFSISAWVVAVLAATYLSRWNTLTFSHIDQMARCDTLSFSHIIK